MQHPYVKPTIAKMTVIGNRIGISQRITTTGEKYIDLRLLNSHTELTLTPEELEVIIWLAQTNDVPCNDYSEKEDETR